jgi:hypothetical protein
MVLDFYGQALFLRIEGWPFGNRPTLERSPQFQAKVIMQSGCVMFLDDKLERAGRVLNSAFGFGSAREPAFGPIRVQRHGGHSLSSGFPSSFGVWFRGPPGSHLPRRLLLEIVSGSAPGCFGNNLVRD